MVILRCSTLLTERLHQPRREQAFDIVLIGLQVAILLTLVFFEHPFGILSGLVVVQVVGHFFELFKKSHSHFSKSLLKIRIQFSDRFVWFSCLFELFLHVS